MYQSEFSYQSLDKCKIVSVGKRRDGGTKFWCLNHKADATAKYGKRDTKCRYAHLPPITERQTFELKVDDYPGGIALWGAVPPVYDTTTLALDKGIHIHARKRKNGKKVIDQTYRKVRVTYKGDCHEVSELDAIYYMVSSVFGFGVKLIHCTRCGYPHLDKDWFSVHPHQSHLCSGCGKSFRDNEIAIGNPIAALQQQSFAKNPKMKRSKRKLKIKQKDFLGGIQIWGSNPAILWTSDSLPESGIHVHAFNRNECMPVIDDTFGQVEIDGFVLDEDQVRAYMGQLSLPHIAGRIKSVICNSCNFYNFDAGGEAYMPRVQRNCSECEKTLLVRGRMRKIVSNPILTTLDNLAELSPLSVQSHDLGLLPETIFPI